MKTLVIYDISEDENRARLRECLRDYGLRHIQYSGFIGVLDPHDRFVLGREAEKYLSTTRDSIYIIPLCDRCVRLCQILSLDDRGLEEEMVEIVG